MAKTIVLLYLFVTLFSRHQANAFPSDAQELVGLNLGGLQADLKTNLFAPDGPLAQLGNEIASGASQLENELNNGAQALQADFNSAANSLAQGAQNGAFGVDLGGLHAELDTNLFTKDGPLAQIGGELEAGAEDLEKNLEAGAKELTNSLADAANQLQVDLSSGGDLLTKGLQDLGNQISASGGASLDTLFQGNGDLFANLGFNSGSNSNGGESTTVKTTGKPSISPQSQSSGSSGLSIFGQISGGLPQAKIQKVKETTNSQNQPKRGRSLNGFSINVGLGQNPGKSSSNGKIGADLQGGGKGNGRVIVTKTITNQQPVLTPEILAELSKSLNLPDLCKAIQS